MRRSRRSVASSAPNPAATVRTADSGIGGESGATGGGERHFEGVVIGRRRQRQLEIALFPGSITDVASRAYVLGLFKGVAPAGAASALDELMGGVIRDFVDRRMIGGNVGEVFVVPVGRAPVQADYLLFVGLGAFDEFCRSAAGGESDAMRLVAESVVRTCVHANIEEIATVLLGGSASSDTGVATGIVVRSFVRALEAADPDRRFRRLTLCERDRNVEQALRAEVLRLAATDLFDGVELEFRDLPAPRVSMQVQREGKGAVLRPSGPAPVYVLARMGEAPRGSGTKAAGELQLETSILTKDSKAAVLTGTRRFRAAELEQLLGRLRNPRLAPSGMERFGEDLGRFVFSPELVEAIVAGREALREVPVVVVHDALASRLPWESLRFGGWVPALEGGVLRQHLDPNLSVAKWRERRGDDAVLDVLLVTNPTQDLPGAELEGDLVRKVLNGIPGVRLAERRGSQATREQLRKDIGSGAFDVIHYAGHAYFDPVQPGRAGVLCHGHEVLSGSDLAGLNGLPALVFFNACESGRIRGGRRTGTPRDTPGTRAETPRQGEERNISLAHAFLSGGVANFLGTYWPVGDAAALRFSETFYPRIVNGEPVGRALVAARQAVLKAGSLDWADYLFYGSPDFVLKRKA